MNIIYGKAAYAFAARLQAGDWELAPATHRESWQGILPKPADFSRVAGQSARIHHVQIHDRFSRAGLRLTWAGEQPAKH
ncbi:MAG: hypothetical protein JXB25_05920 [Deltaproteobacteria bacterium]|nr:hypothetical protein [Deltaproteobacteria bacterium]